MMSKILETLRSMDWSRKLFLGVGLVMAVSGIVFSDVFTAMLGTYFAIKSWFNWGCGGFCANDSCSLPENKMKTDV